MIRTLFSIFIHRLSYIFVTLSGISIHPESFWPAKARIFDECSPKTTEPEIGNRRPHPMVDEMQQQLYFPMLGGGALLLFIFGGFHAEVFSLEMAMKSAVSFLLSFFGGYYLALFLLRELYSSLGGLELQRDRLECFVGYSLSFVLAVEVVVGCMPKLKFMSLISLYLFYIVWCSSEYYLRTDERHRQRFSFFTTVILALSPRIVAFLLHLLEMRSGH